MWKPGTALAEAMQISRESFVSDEIHKLLFGPASTALLSFSYLVFKESLGLSNRLVPVPRNVQS